MERGVEGLCKEHDDSYPEFGVDTLGQEKKSERKK
jgi:hypothetical protein